MADLLPCLGGHGQCLVVAWCVAWPLLQGGEDLAVQPVAQPLCSGAVDLAQRLLQGVFRPVLLRGVVVWLLAVGVLLQDVLQTVAQAWAEQLKDVVAVETAGVRMEVQANGFAEIEQGKGWGNG